ncbi:hypothetical protein PVE_R2G0867 [Pseudomonas veronii 1YdBTEX2]|uniref:N-acetyltransferase domain-containing protein n=2 Tax=Pseudomonas veronii 1YdBTEX2 TaxID=1295141 RepID=A0A1D3K9F3_PSEVE|nr:GNAT family N-acetyltransferase [Pseudomonas veronii]SBW84892.1 hypothetical protein PVE_R2G0867 [Pseudomonas veronii 1YdBTEX2]
MSKKLNQVDVIASDEGFSFRNAEENDLDFIYKLILSGSKNGHFSEAFLTPEGSKGLRVNLRSILTKKQRLDARKPAYGVIYHNEGTPVGFLINSSIYESKGTEIWMMAVSEEFQNAGHGSTLLDEILRNFADYRGVMMARCHPASEVMFKMFIKRGFTHKDTGEEGTRILVR